MIIFLVNYTGRLPNSLDNLTIRPSVRIWSIIKHHMSLSLFCFHLVNISSAPVAWLYWTPKKYRSITSFEFFLELECSSFCVILTRVVIFSHFSHIEHEFILIITLVPTVRLVCSSQKCRFWNVSSHFRYLLCVLPGACSPRHCRWVLEREIDHLESFRRSKMWQNIKFEPDVIGSLKNFHSQVLIRSKAVDFFINSSHYSCRRTCPHSVPK